MCDSCGDPLPVGSTRRRRFCSVRCKNKSQIALRVAANANWRTANPDKVIAQRLAYRDKQAAIMRRYCEQNPEVFANHRHLRRARLRSAGGVGVSPRDWTRLVARLGHKCAYCGTEGRLTVDHVVPISRGGQHSIGNVLPACPTCNTSKSNRLLIEWRLRKRGQRSAA